MKISKNWKKLFTVLLSVVMLAGFATTTWAFTDTAGLDEETKNAITKLTDLKIIEGYEDGTFKPQAKITRAETAKILELLANAKPGTKPPANTIAPKYTDVDATAWYYGHIITANQLALMKGDAEGTFRPNSNISIAETVATMVRLLGYSDQDLAGTWPNNYLQKAVSLGLLHATPERAATTDATRAFVAKMAAKALDLPMAGGTEEKLTNSYGIISGISGDKKTVTIQDFKGKNQQYQVADSAKLAAKDLKLSNLVAYQLNTAGKLTALSQEGVGTSQALSATIKAGKINLNGKSYFLNDTATVFAVSGSNSNPAFTKLDAAKIAAAPYVQGIASTELSVAVQYVLSGDTVKYLLINNYGNLSFVQFGFIEEFGFVGAGIDNGVKFFGDTQSYQIKTGSATPAKDSLFAYTVSGNEASLTLAKDVVSVQGKIKSIDGNLITTDATGNNQFILDGDTAIMKVTYDKTLVTKVENDYKLEVGDSVIVRYVPNHEADQLAAYVLIKVAA